MRKFLALAGVAVALALAAPVAAQADGYRPYDHDGYRSMHYDRDGRRDYREHRRDYREDRRDYRRMERRSFSYWRPHLERRHYRGFGRPVFYGHYYRVRAHDFYGRIVILTVNAYTGAIISIGY